MDGTSVCGPALVCLEFSARRKMHKVLSLEGTLTCGKISPHWQVLQFCSYKSGREPQSLVQINLVAAKADPRAASMKMLCEVQQYTVLFGFLRVHHWMRGKSHFSPGVDRVIPSTRQRAPQCTIALEYLSKSRVLKRNTFPSVRIFKEYLHTTMTLWRPHRRHLKKTGKNSYPPLPYL